MSAYLGERIPGKFTHPHAPRGHPEGSPAGLKLSRTAGLTILGLADNGGIPFAVQQVHL